MKKLAMLMGASLLAAATAQADDTTWKAESERTDDNWATEANWSAGVPTTDNGLMAKLNNGGTVSLGSDVRTVKQVVNINTGLDKTTTFKAEAGGGLTVNNDVVDVGRVAHGNVVFDSGIYSFPYMDAGWQWNSGEGYAYTGTIEIVNADVTVGGNTQLGVDSGYGKLSLSGGSLTSNGDLLVGVSTDGAATTVRGTGELAVSGAAAVTLADGKTLGVGQAANAVSTVTQTGGAVTLNGNAWVGLGNAAGATGRYDISGGTLKTTSNAIVVGRVTGGTGLFNVSGSDTKVEADSISIGGANSATGTMTVASGTVTTVGNINIAHRTDSVGTLTVNGGTVDVGGQVLCTWDDDGSTATVNLNGGTLETKQIQVWTDKALMTVNFNGGTLKAKEAGEIIRNNGTTVNIKAGGMIIDSDYDVTIRMSLNADESLGGIVKKGKGRLTLYGAGNFKITGYIKVEGGTFALNDENNKIEALDKIVVAEGATLDLGYQTYDLKVRSLALEGDDEETKGKIIYGSATQVETQPTLCKAVWTGAHEDDDVANPANWAVYYKDETSGEDVRVSADELPADGMLVVYEGAWGEALPDWSGVAGTKVFRPTGTATVTVDEAGAVSPTCDLTGWKLDASAATLRVAGVRNLSQGTAQLLVTASAGVVDGGAFASVTTDTEGVDAKVAYNGDGTVGLFRAGGLTVIVR